MLYLILPYSTPERFRHISFCNSEYIGLVFYLPAAVIVIARNFLMLTPIVGPLSNSLPDISTVLYSVYFVCQELKLFQKLVLSITQRFYL